MEVHFVLIQRNGKAKKFKLMPEQFVTIGRSEKCQIEIDDYSCSSKHCKIECLETSVIVKDLDSKNGIYINQARTLKQNLYVDDKLKVGESFIYMNIKRMSEETIDLLTYRGKEARGIGNLTIELDNTKKELTKHLNLKQKKKKISQFNSLPAKSAKKFKPNSYQPKSIPSNQTSFLTKSLVVAINLSFIFMFFFLLLYSVRQTYPHLSTIGLSIPFHEFMIKDEVIPFSFICLTSSIILFKVTTKILGASIGELFFEVKK